MARAVDPSSVRTLSSCRALAENYLMAQLGGDRAEALRVILDEGVKQGVSVADLELHVIQPAQREIGRLWQDNRITVAQEHLASTISDLVLANLYQHLPRESPNGKLAVVACVEGELHEMGGRMGADFLEMAGFRVRYLGANVPTESLVALVRSERADLLGLSAAMSFHIPSLERTIAAVRAAMGKDFPILVGGNVFTITPDLETRLDVHAFGTDAREIVRRCQECFGF